MSEVLFNYCNKCVYYETCKAVIRAGLKHKNKKFPEIGECELYKPKDEEKMQASVSTALQAILADRGYKVLELKTFSGATFVGTNIQIKFNEFLLTKCVYCNDKLFATIQNISEVRILFFS